MTTYTRTLSAIAVAAAVAVTTAISAVAGQPPASRGPRPGQGRGGPGGPLPILRQVNLTDAQRDQIKALADEERAASDAQSPARKLAELRRALEAAVFADTPDNAQIDQLRAGIADTEARLLAARVELQLKVAQILSPEQRKLARELSDSRPARAGRLGGPRGVKSGQIPPATQP